jgi:hypothetical protein
VKIRFFKWYEREHGELPGIALGTIKDYAINNVFSKDPNSSDILAIWYKDGKWRRGDTWAWGAVVPNLTRELNMNFNLVKRPSKLDYIDFRSAIKKLFNKEYLLRK